MGRLLQRAGLCRSFGFAAVFLIFVLGTYSPSKSSSANTWSLLRETLYSVCELEGPEQLPILNNSVQPAHGVSEFSVSPNDDGWDAEILTEEGFLSVQKFLLRGGPERLVQLLAKGCPTPGNYLAWQDMAWQGRAGQSDF